MASIKWIRKGRSGANSNTALIDPISTPNTIDGLYGSDLILSSAGNVLQIYLSGNLVAIININEIICWNIQGRNIELITEDPTSLRLGFVNETQALIGLNVIETITNN